MAIATHPSPEQSDAAAHLELLDIEAFLDRVPAHLAGTERRRGNAVEVHPVGVQRTLGRQQLRFHAERLDGGLRRLHARLVVAKAERFVLHRTHDFGPAPFPLVVAERAGRAVKGSFDFAGNAIEESPVVAAAFTFDLDPIGDDVRRLASMDDAEIRCTIISTFADFAVPAAGDEVVNAQSRHGYGTHAALGGPARMAGDAVQRHVDRAAAGGCPRDAMRSAAVPIPGQLRLAKPIDVDKPRAEQAEFFLHGEEEREWRMRQLPFKDFQRRGQHDGHARAIVGPQAGLRVRRLDKRAAPLRLAADADRHRVEMGHQQSPRPAHCAGQSYDQISDLAASRRSFMCRRRSRSLPQAHPP